MDDMVQARNNMHERNKKIEQDKKSKTKKSQKLLRMLQEQIDLDELTVNLIKNTYR